MNNVDYSPRWHKELEIFRNLNPVIIMEGNIFDTFLYPNNGIAITKSMSQYLNDYFKETGYRNIVFYNSLDGFYNHCDQNGSEYVTRFQKLEVRKNENSQEEESGQESDHSRRNQNDSQFIGRNGVSPAASKIREVLAQNQEATVTIMELASRCISSPTNMEQAEIDAFTVLMQASMNAGKAPDAATVEQKGEKPNGMAVQTYLPNLLIMLVDKVNDLPTWFYLNNPKVKTIVVGPPSKEEKQQLLSEKRFKSFFTKAIYDEDIKYYLEKPEELNKLKQKLLGVTEGFSMMEFINLGILSKSQELHIREICKAVDLYKFGIKENPWSEKDNIEKIKVADEAFYKRVKGQDIAISKTLDVVKRAITGMSGIQTTSVTRPKGVLFFAGPTGTGKTETAKTLAEILFGDERNCIRFDMSEYGQPHSDQKLLGAPPGYVGYEAGGQLTNAVRKNPFSILLFDEIEKAHPSVLDKFLQILEDGRMTDGQGNTVYFSETIIIFTSNLGIYKMEQNGTRVLNVQFNESYEDVCKKVKEGIENYFKLTLGRPEILNRIGENIVVFDFIREEIAEQILNAQIDKICFALKENKNIDVTVLEEARKVLLEKAKGNLENGGRGIGNIVENLFVTPLSRYLFDHELFSDGSLTIKSIQAEQQPFTIECV